MIMSGAARKTPDALPLQERREAIGQGAVNAATRTVNLTFTTGAAVERRRYTGWDSATPFREELVVSEGAIDLARLNAGAPVLDSHQAFSTASQIAVVERAWIAGNEGRATVRFPAEGTDAAADRLFGLVAQGIIRNISVGYRIDKLRVVPASKETIERHVVERWTPLELSFVTVPADPGAQVRSLRSGEPVFPVEIAREGMSAASTAAIIRMRQRAIDIGLFGTT